jgi:hypothetical protein
MQKYYNCSVFMAIYNLIMVFVGKRNSESENIWVRKNSC